MPARGAAQLSVRQREVLPETAPDLIDPETGEVIAELQEQIAEIQGTTGTSPYAGKSVVTSGLVTASYPTGGFNGFYLQTPGTGGDLAADHAASDAVFVYLGAAGTYPAIGDHVQVTGAVSEFAGLTEISPAAGGVTTLSDAAAAPVPVSNALPATAAGRESEEGMLQAPAGDFTVSDVYTLNNFGEIDLAVGSTPLRQPTDAARPGTPEAQAVADDNAARAVTLDDGTSVNYLTAANASNGSFSTASLCRGSASTPRSAWGPTRRSRSRWCSTTAAASGSSSRPAR